jgi:hypothetical protein
MPDATLLKVRRAGSAVTFFWDGQPTGNQRKVAEDANPSNGQRIGHSWPGDRDDGAPGAYRVTGGRPFR